MFEGGKRAAGERRVVGLAIAGTAEGGGVGVRVVGLGEGLEVVLEELQVALQGVKGLLRVARRLMLIDLIEELLPVVLD